MGSLPPVCRVELLASYDILFEFYQHAYYSFDKGVITVMHFPCIGQESGIAVGREKQIGHDEDMRGSCMEIEP